METFYLICAGLGGSVIIFQLLASAIGFGADADHDVEHEHDNFLFGLLTLRSVAAALAFFGLAGMTARSYDVPPWQAFTAACFGGFLALYAVASLMDFFHGLKHDGTARLEDAVGQTGTVYLRIPGQNAGPGKVTLTLANRTVECEAFTEAGALTTGSSVRIVGLRDSNTVDVIPIDNTEAHS